MEEIMKDSDKPQSQKDKVKKEVLKEVVKVARLEGLYTEGDGTPHQNWISFHTCNRSAFFRVSAARKNRWRVEAYLTGVREVNEDIGNKLFTYLEGYRSEIDQAFGPNIKVSWESLPGKMATRVAVYRDWPRPSTEETLKQDSEASVRWIMEMLQKFEKAVNPWLGQFKG
jgi:hypothetical protein